MTTITTPCMKYSLILQKYETPSKGKVVFMILVNPWCVRSQNLIIIKTITILSWYYRTYRNQAHSKGSWIKNGKLSNNVYRTKTWQSLELIEITINETMSDTPKTSD